MEGHVGKSVIIHLGKKSGKEEYYLNGEQPQKTAAEKNLGFFRHDFYCIGNGI